MNEQSDFQWCALPISPTARERGELAEVPGLRATWDDREAPSGDYYELQCGLELGHQGCHISEVGWVEATWGSSSGAPRDDLSGFWWLTWSQGRAESRRVVHAELCPSRRNGLSCSLMNDHSGGCLFEVS